MGEWKSCENCVSLHRGWCKPMPSMIRPPDVTCAFWFAIECKYCRGPLSELREHNGRKYRHCYACHMEFYEEERAMAEYISTKALGEFMADFHKNMPVLFKWTELIWAMSKIPRADVVEVVRCKDCINHTNSGLCEGWSRYGTIQTPDDAYCSYGVKIDA